MKKVSKTQLLVTCLVVIAIICLSLMIFLKKDYIIIPDPIPVVDNNSVEENLTYPCLLGEKCS